MKKLIAILLGVVLMASMLAVFTVSAGSNGFEDEFEPEFINGEPYYRTYAGMYLADVLAAMPNYGGKTVHIVIGASKCSLEKTVITTPNYYRFELESGVESCLLYNYETYKVDPMITIAESAAGTVLDFPSTVTLLSRNESGDGGVIYVDAEYCTIDGGWYVDSYAKVDGGAICVNRDNCTIRNCHFKNCRADDDGGAIYFCSGADDGVVWNCTFEGCSSDDEGNFVNGDGDTVINLCTYGDDDDYYHCEIQSFAGSVLSDGSIWIIVAVAVVVIAALVVLIVLKKKKKVIATAGNASDSDDE